MVLTVAELAGRGRTAMTFGDRLKILSIEWAHTTKATELEEHFREAGLEIAHQAIGSYFSGRSVPELPRLVAMMEAMELSEQQRRDLVGAYAEKRPGLRDICRYLVD